MTFVWGRKSPSGRTDYYLRRTAKIDGRSRTVMNIYLGTGDDILDLVRQKRGVPDDFELVSFRFGTIAAIADVDNDIQFMETVRQVTGSAATAKSTLAYLCGRSEEPLSKNAMGEWSGRSVLPVLMSHIPALDTKSYGRNMDRLTPAAIDTISFKLAQRLVAQGHSPSTVFFDTTNFSTEQQPRGDTDRTLPRAGHAKEGNRQAKLVGLATAVTETHIPVIHNTFPGNENDSKHFMNSVDSMIDTLGRLGVKCDDLCFVFDKGMNSEEGLSAITGAKAHFVSSLKRNQVTELLKVQISCFSETYTTEKGEQVLTYRSPMTVMGVNGVVVVAYSRSAEERQRMDYGHAKRRFTDGCGEIASSLDSGRRGRRPTAEGIHRKVNALIPEKWRSVFRYRVGGTIEKAARGKGAMTLTCWIDGKAEREKADGFGRTAIFTDRKDWDDERIARTYFARSAMEEDYHVLKDTLLFPVMPIYHRFDKRIRAHVFMCVMGLLFYRYIQWKVEKATGERVPIGKLAAQLSRIRLGGLITGGGEDRKVRFKLERMEKEERALVKALNLERFVPNKA